MRRTKLVLSLIAVFSTLIPLALAVPAHADRTPDWLSEDLRSYFTAPPPPSYYPEVRSDGAGGFISAWHNRGLKVFVQRYGDTGGPLWDSQVTVTDGSGGVQVYPEIVLSDGGSIVTWQGGRSPLSSRTDQLGAQRVDARGSRMWGDNGIVAGTPDLAVGYEPSYEAVSDGEGGVIMAWADVRRDSVGVSAGSDVFAQRLNIRGELLWGSQGLKVASANGAGSLGGVVADGSGGAIVFWERRRQRPFPADAETSLFAQRVDASGNPLWETDGVMVCSNLAQVSSGTNLSIVGDAGGGAIVLFKRERYTESEGWASGLFAQRVTSQGNVSWDADGVAISLTYDVGSGGPHVMPDGSGGVIVAWQSVRFQILAQRVDSAGVKLWGTRGVNVARPRDGRYDQYFTLGSDGSGGVLLSWQHYHGGGFDLFAQRIDPSGSATWQTGGVSLGNYAPGRDTENNIRLVEGGPGVALLVIWQDQGPYSSYALDGFAFEAVRLPIVERLGLTAPYFLYLTNARNWVVSLVLMGFLLAAAAYLIQRIAKRLNGEGGLRLMSLSLLILADVSFVLSVLARGYWGLDVAMITAVLIVVSFIVWNAPARGGLVSLAAAPLLFLSAVFMNGNYPFGRTYWPYDFLVCAVLVSAGVMTLLWAHRSQPLIARSLYAAASVVIGSLMLLILGVFVVVGAVSLAQSLGALFGGQTTTTDYTMFRRVLDPQVLRFLLLFSLNSIGLICAIIGLRSRRRNASVVGVVFCSIALVPVALFGLSQYAWLLGLLV